MSGERWRGAAAPIGVALVAAGCAMASSHAGARTRQPDLRFTRVLTGPLATDAYSSPSASWMDIDGDGDEDLYVLNGYGSLEPEPVAQKNQLYTNDGTGGFVHLPDHPLVRDVAFSGSATWGDYDNDGDADIFVANQRDAGNFLFRNDGDGVFTPILEGPPVSDGGRSFSAAWVDVDSDGHLDLHVFNGRDGGGGQVDYLYRNVGGGRFERVTGPAFVNEVLPSGGGAWGDFDMDGDPDLFLPVHSSSERSRLYRNEGRWRFTEVTDEAGLTTAPLPGSPSTSVAHWVDWDADGDLDLFVGNTGGSIDFLYANDGSGRFERVTAGRVGLDATYVSDALWADLDNDADLDLVLAVWGGASELYVNDGRGGLYPADGDDFGAVINFASSVSTSDIDGDGDLDLFLTHWPINEWGGDPNQLYRNESSGGRWLRVRVEGRRSNRSAIGALISVTAEVDGESRRQLRQVTSRTSWRSASSHTQHFGLGAADAVERIEVRWPSGGADTLMGPIPLNRTIEIVEGSGTWSARPDA